MKSFKEFLQESKYNEVSYAIEYTNKNNPKTPQLRAFKDKITRDVHIENNTKKGIKSKAITREEAKKMGFTENDIQLAYGLKL